MRFSSSSISPARTVEFGFDEADRFLELFLLGIEFQQLSVEIGGRLEQLPDLFLDVIQFGHIGRDVALQVAFQFDLVPVIPDDAGDLVLLLDAMDVVLVVFRTGTVHLVGQRVELGLQGRQMAGDLIKPHPELQDVPW